MKNQITAHPSKSSTMLRKKIPFPIAILMTFAGIVGSFFLASWLEKNPSNIVEPIVDNTLQQCKTEIVRLNGYQFIRPVLFKQDECEAQYLLPVKTEISTLINSYKSSGIITEASVYLRQLTHGDWISIGEDEKYNPGSLLKVPELITFMKMREKDPGLLDKKIAYSSPLILPKQAYFISKSIEVGKTYTIRELLYYMIAYSDNNATMLLNQRMDLNIFKKVFTDLSIPEPDMTKNDIPISVREYSLFMRVLYNATYLNIDDSEYCTELLSHSDFNKGLISNLPKEIKVAHKFGEANDGINAHFCESGIIYLNNSPYLLTVMTKGKNNTLLPGVIGDISKKVFDMMNHI
jgi:beta-lactamase class A